MLKQSTVTAATQSAARLTSWDIHETSALYSTISCYNKHLLLTVFHLQPRGAYLSERSQTSSLFVLPQICRLLEIEKRQLVNISLPHSFASVCTQMRLFRHRCSLMTTYRATHQWSAAAPQPARTLPDNPVPASEPQTNVTSCICAPGFASF